MTRMHIPSTLMSYTAAATDVLQRVFQISPQTATWTESNATQSLQTLSLPRSDFLDCSQAMYLDVNVTGSSAGASGYITDPGTNILSQVMVVTGGAQCEEIYQFGVAQTILTLANSNYDDAFSLLSFQQGRTAAQTEVSQIALFGRGQNLRIPISLNGIESFLSRKTGLVPLYSLPQIAIQVLVNPTNYWITSNTASTQNTFVMSNVRLICNLIQSASLMHYYDQAPFQCSFQTLRQVQFPLSAGTVQSLNIPMAFKSAKYIFGCVQVPSDLNTATSNNKYQNISNGMGGATVTSLNIQINNALPLFPQPLTDGVMISDQLFQVFPNAKRSYYLSQSLTTFLANHWILAIALGKQLSNLYISGSRGTTSGQSTLNLSTSSAPTAGAVMWCFCLFDAVFDMSTGGRVDIIE